MEKFLLEETCIYTHMNTHIFLNMTKYKKLKITRWLPRGVTGITKKLYKHESNNHGGTPIIGNLLIIY